MAVTRATLIGAEVRGVVARVSIIGHDLDCGVDDIVHEQAASDRAPFGVESSSIAARLSCIDAHARRPARTLRRARGVRTTYFNREYDAEFKSF